MKVKDLIKKLEAMDKEAYVQIRNDSRWKEDAYAVQEIVSDDATVVEIISLQGYKFTNR